MLFHEMQRFFEAEQGSLSKFVVFYASETNSPLQSCSPFGY